LPKLFVAAFAALVVLIPGHGWPQAFPSQPIRIVVPFAAGGNVDVTARAVATDMGAMLGQTVVVENRAGAGGMIGAGFVMSMKPDGHTLLMGSSSTLSVGPNLQKNWPYDPIKGITPIINIQVVPFVLVVRTESDIRSVADLLARAKAKPAEITQAHAGIGSSNHLVSEFFQMLTGTKFLLVPYKGGGPAMNDLLGGQVESYFDQASTALPQIKAGKIKALAVTAEQRMPNLPDVPTFKELGIGGFEILNVTGLVGPAGMDPAVVARIRAATVKALDNPTVKQLFETLGVQIQASTPERFGDFIRQDLARWGRVIKEANVQVN